MVCVGGVRGSIPLNCCTSKPTAGSRYVYACVMNVRGAPSPPPVACKHASVQSCLPVTVHVRGLPALARLWTVKLCVYTAEEIVVYSEGDRRPSSPHAHVSLTLPAHCLPHPAGTCLPHPACFGGFTLHKLASERSSRVGGRWQSAHSIYFRPLQQIYSLQACFPWIPNSD